MKNFTSSKTIIAIALFLAIFANESFAQVPTVQDCLGAIPICQSHYSENGAYSGTGNYLNEINPGSSCLNSGEKNSVWYIISITHSGNLAFTITPNYLNDDFDWAVYNITDNVCADIFTNPELEVSCNYSGTIGPTGPNGGSDHYSQGAGGTPLNAVIPVMSNDIYVINVSQFSPSSNGYLIDFSASTAVIYDDVTPNILRAGELTACNSEVVKVHFNENILCSSVDALDFRVFGPGDPNVISVNSPTCNATVNAGYGIDFELNLDRPLEAGNYQVFVFPHADTSIVDNCGNQCNGGFPEAVYFSTAGTGLDVTFDVQQPTCPGGSDAVLTTNVQNHTPLGSGGDAVFTFENQPQDNFGVYTGLNAGTYTVFVETTGGCSSTNSVTIADPQQVMVSAGADISICDSSTVTLFADNSYPGNGTWTTTDPTATFNNTTLFNPTVSNLSTGRHTYVWTNNIGACGFVSDSLVLINSPTPTPAVAGTDMSNCGYTATLAGNIPAKGTGIWTTSGTSVIENPALNNSAVSNLSPGANAFTWTIISGVCTPESDEVIITSLSASFPDAGEDIELCNSTTATLAGNNPSTGTGGWTSLSAGIIYANSTLFNTSIAGLPLGTSKFVWTIGNGTCPAASDTVAVTNSANPTVADAGSPKNVCDTDMQFDLSGNNPAVGIGQWTTSGSGIIAVPSQYNSSISNLDIGHNTITWTISNGACTPSVSDVLFINYEGVGVVFAGNDTAVCENSIQLSANAPVVGYGFWVIVGGSGTITNVLEENTTVSALGLGENLFKWRIENGVCLSADTVAVTYTTPAEITDQPDHVSTAAGSNVSFSVTATGDSLAYQWRKDGSDIPLADSSALELTSVSVADRGNYDVFISNSCGAIASDIAILQVVTSTDELAKMGVEIFPNPSSGKFTVQLLNENATAELTISDMAGKIIYNAEIYGNKTLVDLKTNSGMYFVKIKTDGQTSIFPIIIKDALKN